MCGSDVTYLRVLLFIVEVLMYVLKHSGINETKLNIPDGNAAVHSADGDVRVADPAGAGLVFDVGCFEIAVEAVETVAGGALESGLPKQP